jgi:hypothetical protein
MSEEVFKLSKWQFNINRFGPSFVAILIDLVIEMADYCKKIGVDLR